MSAAGLRSLPPLFFCEAACPRLIGEAEMQHVAVLHHVVLAFEAELAGVARSGLADSAT